MLKILKYSFNDLLRSKWTLIYLAFFLIATQGLLYITGDSDNTVVGLLNIVVILCPLIATIFGTVNFYNSREFTELLLAQPIKRKDIFLGQYFGMTLSLSLGYALGVFIPFLIHSLTNHINFELLAILLVVGVFLTFIFSALSFLISLITDDKIKGFGISILSWLLLALVYDGVQLYLLSMLSNYPLEKISLALTFLNPIDLSRILLMLKLDISALLGYTGAVFNKFFGSYLGYLLSFVALAIWVLIPLYFINRVSMKKDF
ncbi:MAG: ABC transporter permease [Chlorobiota bacterium]